MIILRMADGVQFTIHSSNIEEFTDKFQIALENFEPLEIARPDGKYLRYINPFQVLYYEIKE